jgi:hypothetical protein
MSNNIESKSSMLKKIQMLKNKYMYIKKMIPGSGPGTSNITHGRK